MRSVPDGLTGTIMAIEGISDAAIMLHGPGGCRVRHMVLSEAVMRRDENISPFTPYFYGYPRVPATFLDEDDFINGARDKSRKGLSEVAKRSPSLIAIVDSPGASLIGDDHARSIAEEDLEGVALHLPEPNASVPATTAVDRTLRTVMEFLDPVRDRPEKGTAVLLGISLMDKDWLSARDELSGYLEDMGLSVVCCPGAGSSVNELVQSANAEFAVVVCPEMCMGLSEWYASIGATVIRSDMGAPVGLDALKAWIEAVANATGRDPSGPLEKVAECRKRIRDRLVGMRYNALRIRGLTFSVAGTASIVRPLTEWFYSYLAMAPVAVVVDNGAEPSESNALRSFLEEKGFGDAWGKEPVPCGAVLCEGITALTMRASGDCRAGIPIGYSSMGLDDIIPRPIYGIQGAMYILDELLHGVRGS